LRDDATDGATTMVAVAAVNRNGNESKRVTIKTPEWKPAEKEKKE
jgi:NaMN:DMB phosphoribosyltransferase